MSTPTHHKKTDVRFEHEDDHATPDDLRVIIAELKECWQLGDHMREARSALLRVFTASAERLTAMHNHTPFNPYKNS